MGKGLFIVIEGSDANGKATQSQLLLERLPKEKQPVLLSFPQYEQPYGKLIRQYLNDDAPTRDPAYASLLYAADRATQKAFIEDHLEKGGWIIADRFTPSTLAHQLARLHEAPEAEREQFTSWVENMEYTILDIPQPDVVIILDIDHELSLHLLAERRQNRTEGYRDIAEDDAEHLRIAAEEYQKLADRKGWTLLHCSQNGQFLPKQQISDMVMQAVENAARMRYAEETKS